LAQVKQLVTWSAAEPQQRIVAGDFNGWPGTTEISEMLKTHADGWLAAKAKGTAIAYPSNPDGNTRNTRIDYVWASRGATSLVVTKAQVFDTRDASGKKPSDHNPLIVTIQVN
jgi:endonuclease/exonuclease/phosphatase family metal-dependent hydrolase